MITLVVPTSRFLEDIYEIRNHKSVRQWMSNQNSFTLKEHIKYLRKQMRKKDFHIFAAVVNSETVGYIRLKKESHYYDLSYAVHPDHQGKAYAYKMISSVRKMGFKPLQAKIKPNNTASIKTIEKFNFIDASTKEERLFLEKP